MALGRKETDKKAKRLSLLIAVGVHLLLIWIFWQAAVPQEYKDRVVEIFTGKNAAPPPPPKPKVKLAAIKQPTSFKPKFEVKSSVKVDPKFNPNFKVMANFNADVSMPDFTSMAQTYSVKTFSLDKSQIQNVTTDILNVIGVGDLMDEGRGTKVSGRGKRMRARLNLCIVSTPGITQLDFGGTGRWDYVFTAFKSIERTRAWLKENTQIQVTENTITIPCEYDFTEWVQKIKTKGALAVDSSSYYQERTALLKLEQSIEQMETDRIAGRRQFVRTVKATAYSYLNKKYAIEDIDLLKPDMIIKKIEEQFLLREWRKKGIQTMLEVVNNLDENWPEDRLVNAIKPVYSFLRNAMVLENPLLIIANLVGLEKLSDENLQLLRTYVTNGGFIWIDDTGIAGANIPDQYIAARGFISNLMPSADKLSEKEQETFNKLSADDKTVQGFDLGKPFPPFAHPQVFIPMAVPRDVPVDVRIFNRLGILVKQFSWDKNKPMKAGSYVTKEKALVWNCDNNAGEPVESGNFFLQMQSGLFQRTRLITVGKLRMIDEKHPLMSVVHNFRNVPVCVISSGNANWKTRPYGNAAFGYYYEGRMILLYTEGAGVIAGLGDLNSAVVRDQANKFLNNVIAFVLSDEDGVAIRP